MTPRRGFFTDPDGKRSMTRLCALLLTLCVPLALWTGAGAAQLTAIIGGGVVALLTRVKGP